MNVPDVEREREIRAMVDKHIKLGIDRQVIVHSLITEFDSYCSSRELAERERCATEMYRVHMFVKAGPPPRLEYLGFDSNAAAAHIRALSATVSPWTVDLSQAGSEVTFETPKEVRLRAALEWALPRTIACQETDSEFNESFAKASKLLQGE